MLGVVVAAIVFMAMDTPQIAGRMRHIAYDRSRIARAMTQFATGVRRYWLVTTIFGLIVVKRLPSGVSRRRRIVIPSADSLDSSTRLLPILIPFI